MASRVVFRPSAEADLSSIAFYVAADSGFERAYSFVDRIELRCLKLADFPGVGRDRSDIRSGLRTIAFERRTVIVYLVAQGLVEILRVLYGGRDIEAELATLR